MLRTHGDDESRLLNKERIGTVFFGEEELAKGMMNHVLQRFGPQSARGVQGQRAIIRTRLVPCKESF